MSFLRFTFVLLFNFAFFHAKVLGDGPTCSQMGAGPDDMIMESPSGLIAMNPKYMWDKRGDVVRVPVVLDHAYTHKDRSIIFNGLQEIASKTCVKFAIHKDPHYLRGHDYVYISKTKSKGCWSYVGRVGNGKQDLSLPVGCINHRTVVHEVMHALGFSHEHVRQDRDNYVEILWRNIQRGRERNFEKKHGRADPFGPYDYDSIMHYERNAFSTNGHDTIRPLRGHAPIGRGRHMSHWDVVKINRMYKCNGRGGGIGGGFGGGGGSPFFSFGGGGFSGSPEGNNEVDSGSGDDDVSGDDNNSGALGSLRVGGNGNGAAYGEDDDSENDVFSGIDNEFRGLFPESPAGAGPGAAPALPPSPRVPPGRPHGPFHRPPLGLPPPGPGPRGAPPPLLGSPLATGPDYDDTPKGPGGRPAVLGAPGHSFPDNPFATIPHNPFTPRSGLPSNSISDSPGLGGAPAFYDTQPDYNY